MQLFVIFIAYINYYVYRKYAKHHFGLLVSNNIFIFIKPCACRPQAGVCLVSRN